MFSHASTTLSCRDCIFYPKETVFITMVLKLRRNGKWKGFALRCNLCVYILIFVHVGHVGLCSYMFPLLCG